MTDTEAKALALELRTRARGIYADMTQSRLWSALVLAADHIESIPATEARHAAELREQAERFDAFRRDVSNEVAGYVKWRGPHYYKGLDRFIIPAPDPLVEAEKLISTLRADEREGYAVAGQAAETISNLVAALRAQQKDTNA